VSFRVISFIMAPMEAAARTLLRPMNDHTNPNERMRPMPFHSPHFVRAAPLRRHGLRAGSGLLLLGIFLLARGAGALAGGMPPPESPPLPACVVNGTDNRLILLLVTPAGGRLVQETAPGAALCMTSVEPVIAMSFGSADALEGCSVKLAPGESVTLLAHEDFDRCRWAPPMPTPRH